MGQPPGILFTAFEPSGEALAGPVIQQLKRLRPQIPIWAVGGSQMEEAGAELIEKTGGHAAMLLHAVGQALEHKRRLRRLDEWLKERPLAALVPVDSPAANWSICRLTRRHRPRAAICHLPAPQVWAWARWRVRRLRRLTDHVLCILPFEPPWLSARGIKATFVGHPLFDHDRPQATDLDPPGPTGSCKLALLPGSRRKEIDANWPLMLETFQRLRSKHPDLVGLVAAVGDDAAQQVRKIADGCGVDLPAPHLGLRVGQTDAVLAWCDLALIVSGTATLQAAAHRRPMVALFKLNPIGWHLVGRWVVRTRPLTLPNLIARTDGDGDVIDELVPHLGPVDPICAALERLVDDERARARQAASLERVVRHYRSTRFAESAANCILQQIDEG